MSNQNPKPVILLIEDDIGIGVLIREWLARKMEGIPVIIEQVGTIHAGLERASHAALIILDLGLPDSPTPRETLKNIPLLRESAPVIVLTGYEDAKRPAESEILMECVKEWGAYACIFKTMLDLQGMEWFMLVAQAAMCNRVYEKKTGAFMPAVKLHSLTRKPWKLFPIP